MMLSEFNDQEQDNVVYGDTTEFMNKGNEE